MDKPYLCQVNARVSCGACCGLYNVHNLTRGGLKAMLATRTAAFARVPREAEAIEDFGRQSLGWTPADRPFPRFYPCPYVGLIGEHRRVGCLLHPEVPGNNGRDWRELSYYGAKACRTYFCPTMQWLTPERQFIIRQSIDHWFLYGLVVTEHRLWSAFFKELDDRIGRPATRADFENHPDARARLQAFAGLKLKWLHRRADARGPCNYFFDNGLYHRPAVERSDAAIPASPYDSIFREFESHFASRDDMRRAEQVLEGLFNGLVSILSDAC
ncbi:MAG: hypothetical protein JJV98_13695 [Desulfosarcina sp.]|nr:hypothetical protein [Desulfobacterales bacterium]